MEEVGEKGKITKQNRLDLLGRIKSGFKKLDYNTLYNEKFEIKDYHKALNLPDARLKFSLRTKMTKKLYSWTSRGTQDMLTLSVHMGPKWTLEITT